MQYRVDIIESERGWGQRINETVYFDDLEEAQQFVTRFNSSNTAPRTPDWYMFAEKPVKVQKH